MTGTSVEYMDLNRVNTLPVSPLRAGAALYAARNHGTGTSQSITTTAPGQYAAFFATTATPVLAHSNSTRKPLVAQANTSLR